MKTLEELGCYMHFERNVVLQSWNGYLIRKGFHSGYIKCFIYDTKEESTDAALKWANNNTRALRNGKKYEKACKEFNKLLRDFDTIKWEGTDEGWKLAIEKVKEELLRITNKFGV